MEFIKSIIRNILLFVIVIVFICILPACNSTDSGVDDSIHTLRDPDPIMKTNEIKDEIHAAIDSIPIVADGTAFTLRQYLDYKDSVGGAFFSAMRVDIDFQNLFFNTESNVIVGRRLPRNGITIVAEYVDEFIDRLYTDVRNMFYATDNLTICESGFNTILEYYLVPSDWNELANFSIGVGRFLNSPDKQLRIETHFGNLDISSEFFFGRTGIGATRNHALQYHIEDESGNPLAIINIDEQSELIINMEIIDTGNNNMVVGAQNPGQTALMTIPIDAYLMRDSMNNLRYNAVEFISSDGSNRGVLPRSFIDGDNLYIYVNRTGKFRLVSTPEDSSDNVRAFLRDRGIVFNGHYQDGEKIVTRAEFYGNLMQIHWVEDLHFDTVQSFDDLRGAEWATLERRVNVGQFLGVLEGFPDGLFHPNENLLRSQMFRMLAGNIRAFGYDIEWLLPPSPNLVGVPPQNAEPNEPFWYEAVRELRSYGFLPESMIDGIPHVNPDGFVTVEEAEKLLYLLITTTHFQER